MKNLIRIILFLFILPIFVSCSKKNEDSSKIIVGISPDNPPYEFLSSYEMKGFDIDLINLIGRELKKEVVLKNLDFSGLMPALLSNNVDMVISGLTVKEKRKENVDFSIPYVSTRISVIFKENNDFKSLDDLKGKKIGAQIGTVWADLAFQIQEKDQSTTIKLLSNNLTLIQELSNSNIDAVILEDIQIAKFKEGNSLLRSFDVENSDSEFAIAFSKNSKLTEDVNKAIKKLIDSGEIDELKEKWLK